MLQADTVERHGRLTLAEVLQPAIDLAEGGFPVHEVAAHYWAAGASRLLDNEHGKDMLLNGRAPTAGEVMVLPHLANTFKLLGAICSIICNSHLPTHRPHSTAAQGKAGFNTGTVAQAIVDAVQAHGGVMSLDDLRQHTSTFEEPISVSYKGVDVHEIAPNGQGITALIALNILEGLDLRAMGHNTPQYLHALIEALRLAFADARYYVADSSVVPVPTEALLKKAYAAERRKLIDPAHALHDPARGSPAVSSDTVYFTVTDNDGNACSFINSNYMGFGTGLVPRNCGFTLQNRGANFVLDAGHPNVLAPGKRPYHTIIPAIATRDGELYASFGVMGGFMQPQGHVQVLLNMLEFGMSPQQALDAPRFCIGPAPTEVGEIALEEGISESTRQTLQDMGHHHVHILTGHARALFGRGQIIAQSLRQASDGSTRRVYTAGSDPRADGLAVGY